MSEERISVGAERLLNACLGRIAKASSCIQKALEALSPTPPGGDPNKGIDTTKLTLLLREAQVHLDSGKDSLSILEVAPAPFKDEQTTSTRVTAGQQGEPQLALDMTSRHRMSEMAASLKITEASTMERCVATQHFIDAKLSDGWRFVAVRGRERRAVTFPGQRI